MKDSEAITKAVIEKFLPGARLHYRFQQSSGEYDFDLIFQNGHIVPLEVTVSTDPSYKEMMVALQDKGGFFVNRKLCCYDWYVHPATGANVRKIRRHIDSYLAKIEAEGKDKFFAYTDAGSSVAISRIHRDLRIEAGEVFHWKPPGKIGISPPIQETDLDPEHFMRAVESEANKLDNRKKLDNRNSAERHLVVLIEDDNFSAWYAINNNSLATLRLPKLPTEITHVWAVASSTEFDKYTVWKASNDECWAFAGKVLLTRDQIQRTKQNPD